MRVYLEDFADWDDVKCQFSNYDKNDSGAPEAEPEHVFAVYEYECYKGSAVVAYFLEGKFYIVEGSHCSCDGLEDQFDPTEYEPDIFLAMVNRLDPGSFPYGLEKYKTQLLNLYEAAVGLI